MSTMSPFSTAPSTYKKKEDMAMYIFGLVLSIIGFLFFSFCLTRAEGGSQFVLLVLILVCIGGIIGFSLKINQIKKNNRETYGL